MRGPILLSLLLYTFMIIILIVTLYGFFTEEVDIIVPSLLIMIGSLIIGFMLNFFLLQEKFKLDNKVLDLTKEILHELTIPISTIQANSLLLKRQFKEDEKSLKRLSRIEDSSKRLERLYEELFYGIKKEMQSVDKEKILLTELILERVEALELLERNPFSLELEPTLIFVDKIGFEKMLDNILVNAMKYSSKENVIEISLSHNLLTITDFGIGMTELELQRSSKRYYQSDKRQDGEGIGLALVQEYCKNEKIKMWIVSEKERGTKVSLELKKVLFKDKT